MRALLLVLWLMPSLIQAQMKTAPMSEDRVRVIVTEEGRRIATQLTSLQKQQIDILQQNIKQKSQALQNQLENYRWWGYLITILLGGGIFSIFVAIVRTRKYVRKKIENEIEFAVYRLDPRRWPIRVPMHNFEKELQRLQGLKYKNLIPCGGLDAQCKTGITVFRAESDDDLKLLHDFMAEEKVNPLKCCFVIYYTGQQRLNTGVLQPYDNYVLCNMPGTLSSQIFAASRNILYER